MIGFLHKNWIPSKFIFVLVQTIGTEKHYYVKKIEKKTSSFTLFHSIEAILKAFGKEKPYIIHVLGLGVLIRSTENIPNYQDQLIVNGNKDEFYFTSIELGSKLIVSFFRKSVLEHELIAMKNQNAYVLNVTSGIIPCIQTIKILGKLSFDFNIEIKDEKLISFERNEEYTKKLLEGFDEEYANQLAQNVLLFLQDKNVALQGAYTSSEKKVAFNLFKDYYSFKVLGLGIVFSILIALIANYFYVNHLNQKIADQEAELMLNNENLSLLNRLEQEKTRKQQLILTAGLNSSSFVSFYIYEVAKSVPTNISLINFSLFPLKERLKQKRKVEIDQTQLLLEGTSSSSKILDDWMEKMNRFEWVSRVELLNYTKITDQLSTFKLTIQFSK